MLVLLIKTQSKTETHDSHSGTHGPHHPTPHHVICVCIQKRGLHIPPCEWPAGSQVRRVPGEWAQLNSNRFHLKSMGGV